MLDKGNPWWLVTSLLLFLFGFFFYQTFPYLPQLHRFFCIYFWGTLKIIGLDSSVSEMMMLVYSFPVLLIFHKKLLPYRSEVPPILCSRKGMLRSSYGNCFRMLIVSSVFAFLNQQGDYLALNFFMLWFVLFQGNIWSSHYPYRFLMFGALAVDKIFKC